MASFPVPKISSNKSGWGPQPSSIKEDASRSIMLPPTLNHNIGSSNITSLKTLVSDWTGSSGSGYRYADSSFTTTESAADAFTVVAHQPSTPAVGNIQVKRKNAWTVQKEHAQSQQKTYTMEQQKQIHRTLKKSSSSNKNRFFFSGTSRQQREAQQAQLYRNITTSIAVRSDWVKVATIPFKDLNSMHVDENALSAPEDIKLCGSLDAYDKKYDRVNTKSAVPLKPTSKVFIDGTTTEDPILNSMKLDDMPPETIKIFATDQLLALLIAASRTVYPWDIVIRKVGNNIYLDKRPGEVPMIELLTVNENSVRDAPSVDDRDKKNVNSAFVVTHEAFDANHNFTQFVLNPNAHVDLPDPNPFKDTEGLAEQVSAGYRYRKWTLPNNMVLVARCELNALLDPNVPENERKYLLIKTLVEYFGSSTPSNWSSRLDSQRAAVLLTEFKNNTAKMTRFTAQALLAGVDQIKLGLISRANPSNPRQHRILGIETYQPAILARTVKLYNSNMWGVLHGIFSIIAKQEGDAVFVLLHAPNKQQLDLYKVNNEQDLLNESSVASDVTDQEQEEQEI